MFLRKKKSDEQNIKTKTFRNLLKIILWVVIIFVLFKGVMTIIKGDQASAIEDNFLQEKENLEQKRVMESEAVSFAEDFAQDYMTYYGNNEEYGNRLSKYTNLEFKNDQNKIMGVIYVNTDKLKWINRNLIYVDCRLKVNYGVSDTKSYIDDNTNTKNSQKNTDNTDSNFKKPDIKIITLRIVVTVKNGKNIIESYPSFIANREKASGKGKLSIPGEDIDDGAEKEKIKNVISNFITAYCAGNKTDMEYFMLNQKDLHGLDKEFEVKSLIDENLVIKKYDGDYLAKVNYILTDSENEFMQSMEFVLVYKDNKYLIKKFDTALNY